MAQANDYDLPPRTPPPAYASNPDLHQGEEGRRQSRTAWGGEAEGAWTTAEAGGNGGKLTQENKNPKTLGPSVEVITVPTPRNLYDAKLNENEVEVKRAKRCRCTLITLLVIKSIVIVGLVIGMAVGFHKLKKHAKHDDDANNLCAGRTCSYNGYCQQFELGSLGSFAYCTCYTGYTGMDCEQTISSGSCGSCVHGQCKLTNLFVDYGLPVAEPAYGSQADVQPDAQPSSAQVGPGGAPKSTTPCAKDKRRPSTTPKPTPPMTGGDGSTFNSGLYQCVCDVGYQGVSCDIPIDSNYTDPCAGVMCSYRGKCVPNAANDNGAMPPSSPMSDETYPANPSPPAAPSPPSGSGYGYGNPPPSPSTSSYTCMCQSGYSGQNCEIAYATATNNNAASSSTACNKNPCLNNGSCVSWNDGTYSCLCFNGYTGTNCEEKPWTR